MISWTCICVYFPLFFYQSICLYNILIALATLWMLHSHANKAHLNWIELNWIETETHRERERETETERERDRERDRDRESERETETERDRERDENANETSSHPLNTLALQLVHKTQFLTDYSCNLKDIIKEFYQNLKDTRDESLKTHFDLQNKLQCYSTLNRTTKFTNYTI